MKKVLYAAANNILCILPETRNYYTYLDIAPQLVQVIFKILINHQNQPRIMNKYQQAFAGDTDAQRHYLTNQVNLFLFDLKNEAAEHGFRVEDSWTLQLATEEQTISLKRHRHPMISLKLHPDILLSAFRAVKIGLQQPLSRQESEVTVSDIGREGISVIVAYSSREPRV